MNAQAVNQWIKRLVAITTPNLASFEQQLGATAQQTDENPHWTFYQFTLPSPWAGGELRLQKAGGQALLVLTPQVVLTDKDLELKQWGELKGIDPNPHIPPEGADTYWYEVNGVKLAFQFTHETYRLQEVALQWGE